MKTQPAADNGWWKPNSAVAMLIAAAVYRAVANPPVSVADLFMTADTRALASHRTAPTKILNIAKNCGRSGCGSWFKNGITNADNYDDQPQPHQHITE